MRYTVVRDTGVPVGAVELKERELAAGRLARLPGYAPLRETVRAGSAALLALGFFGAAAAGVEPAGALAAAAALHFDLLDPRGELVPTTFVNLIEAPADGAVVVLARFRDAHAAVPARLTPPPGAGGQGASPPA